MIGFNRNQLGNIFNIDANKFNCGAFKLVYFNNLLFKHKCKVNTN